MTLKSRIHFLKSLVYHLTYASHLLGILGFPQEVDYIERLIVRVDIPSDKDA